MKSMNGNAQRYNLFSKPNLSNSYFRNLDWSLWPVVNIHIQSKTLPIFEPFAIIWIKALLRNGEPVVF